MSNDAPWILSWYRARDLHRPIVRMCTLGAALLVAGSLATGAALTHVVALADPVRAVLGLLGSVAVIGGPTVTIVGITRHVLRDTDSLLLLRSDGVVVKTHALDVHIAWDDLDEALVADDGTLELCREDGSTVRVAERFERTADELVREIAATHRRALMGLLRPPPAR